MFYHKNVVCEATDRYFAINLVCAKSFKLRVVIFPIKEGFRLLRTTYEVLLKLTWNRTELFIDDVKFEEDRWIVSTNNRVKATKKVHTALDILENSVRDILNIDKICVKNIEVN